MYIDIQQIPRYEMLEVIVCVWQEALDSHAVSNDILVSKKLITNSKIWNTWGYNLCVAGSDGLTRCVKRYIGTKETYYKQQDMKYVRL